MASGIQGAAENPIFARLRHRQLIAFLDSQRHDAAFNALLYRARDEFSEEHMKLLVTGGRWDDALEYLDSFLPACARSSSAKIFHTFLLMHRHIAGLVAGDRAARDAILADGWMRHVVYALGQAASHTRLDPVMARSVLFLDDVRACMDWERVRSYAADTLGRLVWQTPELNRSRRILPDRQVVPHDLLPVGLGLSMRRRMKKQGTARVKSADVARAIRRSRRHIRRLKWSTFDRSFDEDKEWLATLVDESLQGGIHVGCYVLQTSGKEGSPSLPIWKVTSPAESPGVTEKTNADLRVMDPTEGTCSIDLNNPPLDNGNDYFEREEETLATIVVGQGGVGTTDTRPTLEICTAAWDTISSDDCGSLGNVTILC